MGLCIQDNGEISVEKNRTITGRLKGIAKVYTTVEKIRILGLDRLGLSPGLFLLPML